MSLFKRERVSGVDGTTCSFIDNSFQTDRNVEVILSYLLTSKKDRIAGQWWWTPLIPALRRQRQVDF